MESRVAELIGDIKWDIPYLRKGLKEFGIKLTDEYWDMVRQIKSEYGMWSLYHDIYWTLITNTDLTTGKDIYSNKLGEVCKIIRETVSGKRDEAAKVSYLASIRFRWAEEPSGSEES